MQNSRKTLALAQVALRHFSRTAPNQAETVSTKFQQLKEIQKKFGVDDNVPVHLKGGILDKFLYTTTCVVTFVGLGLSVQLFYDLS